MSQFYDRMASTALRLIEQFGQEITLRDTGPGTYDPVTGQDTPGATIDQPAQAILQDYALQQAGMSYADGTVIRQGDKKILVAAMTEDANGQPAQITPPTLTTTVIADGATWTIVNIKEINPAGTPLVYELQGRR
ncbi:hypothetical protein [Stutzerimonas stutzeri]|uniref:Phage protein n=1 Tax=Stutzerimonas stutzeri TaxID=316 RepID=A0A172WRF0_STUST|nr:hypothetical protein [Stutzerimonas stutzeri]ANF26032.1 hypothetical protein PS273GM_13200 [Stutzerimonas stutzeri]